MDKSQKGQIKVVDIQQVSIAVKNLRRTIKSYWEILGIGPWAIFDSGSPVTPDLTYYGKPSWGKYLGALAQVGPIEIELFETLEGDSIYQDWINKHGEGLNHLKLFPDDLKKTKQILTQKGYPTILSGSIKPNYWFAYFEIPPLHCIWEMSTRDRRNNPNPPQGARIYPSDSRAKSPAEITVSNIKQVGICVKDVMLTAKNYWEILGIGPWEVFELDTTVITNRTYYGKQIPGIEKEARTRVGNVDLVLVQSVKGKSIYQDWMDKHGECLHHLTFYCDDLKSTSQILKKHGCVSMQSGSYINSATLHGGYHYFYIKPLHSIWKIVQPIKTLAAKPIAIIPYD